MWDQLRQLKQLKKDLANESITIEHQGHKLTINGNQEITDLQLSLEGKDQETVSQETEELINKAIKDCQTMMARKMQASGNMPSLS